MLPYADINLVGEIKKHQLNSVEDDYREGMIENYLTNKDEVCIVELWQKALK